MVNTSPASHPISKYIFLALGILVVISIIVTTRHYLQINPLKKKFPQQNNSKVLVALYAHGGLCPAGNECTSTTTISIDGSVEFNNAKKTNVSMEQINKLQELINNTNFSEIKSKKFTGTCPTAYDGQEVIYTFNTPNNPETIASCTVEIDINSPLVLELNTIISQAQQ